MRLALVVLIAAASARPAPADRTDALALVRSRDRTAVLLGEAGEPDTFTRIVLRRPDGRWGGEAPIPPLRGVPFMLRDSLWTATDLAEAGGRHSYLIASSEQAAQAAHRLDPFESAVAWAMAPVDGWTLLLVEQLAGGELVAQRIVGEGAAQELEVADMITAGRWPPGSRLMAVDAIASGSFVMGGLTGTGVVIATSVDEAGVATTRELPALQGTEVAVAHAGASPMIFATGDHALSALRLDSGSPSEPMTMPLDAMNAVASLKACSMQGDRALAVLLVRSNGGDSRLLAATSDGLSLVRDDGLPESLPGAASAPAASARDRIALEERAARLRARVIGGVLMGGLLLALLILMTRLAAQRR